MLSSWNFGSIKEESRAGCRRRIRGTAFQAGSQNGGFTGERVMQWQCTYRALLDLGQPSGVGESSCRTRHVYVGPLPSVQHVYHDARNGCIIPPG